MGGNVVGGLHDIATEEPEQILSQDTRGRVLVTPERRELLLAEYDRSGMSGMKFAQYLGIKYSTLTYWRKRHAKCPAGIC